MLPFPARSFIFILFIFISFFDGISSRRGCVILSGDAFPAFAVVVLRRRLVVVDVVVVIVVVVRRLGGLLFAG